MLSTKFQLGSSKRNTHFQIKHNSTKKVRFYKYTLLKVKNSSCVCRKFLPFNAYQLYSSYQTWVRFIFVYQKSLKQTFKTGVEYKITFWNCVLVLLIHKGYCLDKNLVWNVRIKVSGIQIFLQPKKQIATNFNV